MTLQELKAQFAELRPDRADTFVASIHTAYAERSVNALQLISFLDGIVDGFVPSWKSADRRQLTLHGRILAAEMIVLQQTCTYERLTERTRLLLTWCASVVKKEYDYVNLFLDSLNYPVVATGLDWNTLQTVASLDVICHHLHSGIRFGEDDSSRFSFIGKGCLDCEDGVLQLGSSNAGASGVTAFSVADRIEVYTRNAREAKLKDSDRDDVEALTRFAEKFLNAQNAFVVRGPQVREYEVGDTVNVKITGITDDEDPFICDTVDPDRKVSGRILNEELVKGLWTEDLIPYLLDGDCIQNARVADKDGEEYLISIKNAYLNYALECAQEDYKKCAVMECKVIRYSKMSGGRIVWMTPSGYGGVSYPLATREMKPGETMAMSVHSINDSGQSVYINLCPPEYDDERFDKPFGPDEEAVLLDFVAKERIILAEMAEAEAQPENRGKDRETVRMLASILTSRAVYSAGLDSYRKKLVALFLAKLTEDVDAGKALEPELFYDRCRIAFAQGSSVPAEIPEAVPQDRAQVVRMLSLWDSPLADVLHLTASLPAESLASEVGLRILGLKLASCQEDEYSAKAAAVRRNVSALLGVEKEFRNGTVARRGKYGKTESQEKEFKSSYVFRNDNRGADIDHQGRLQVFKAVCGFLNADGGIVYVGVNDDGDPILAKDAGLNADMAWLQGMYKTLNRQRIQQLGHPVCEVKTLDSYVQFLNSEKELYFNESLQGNIRIEVTEDVDAIRITVAPSEYEIAYLYPDKTRTGGTAYVRNGNRTIEMSPGQIAQRLRELKKIDKEIDFVVQIQKAIHEQGKLLFKGYSSGNSGEVQDRRVVPICLFYNDENVYCYDLASHMNKQFRLHRISAIERLEGKFPMEQTKTKQPDVFRWLDEGDGQQKYHIKLRLAAAARNYLLEEYSCAERLPAEEFYPDPEKNNKWILDTHLNGLAAVRRFYLGLADKIEILETEDSEALKEDVAEFVRRNVSF
jgi:hypothetical protein